MAPFGMLRRVALVRTDVSEEVSATFIRVARIGEIGPALATRRNIPKDAILHSHRRKNLKFYILELCFEN
jgi:DNA-binding TFAR19-related protein (PDSD5 family)